MIIILNFICIILMLIIFLILYDLKRIIEELNYINKNDSNGEITTNTNLSIIRNLTQKINFNLHELHSLKEQQETQNKQFNQMLTNITHDIKTPLTVSMGYVQLLIQKKPQDKDLIKIQNNLNSVNYYLHYLMDFNLLREKSANLVISEFILSDTLKKELFNYYDQLNEKNIKVQINITPNISVESDELLFKRVFQNLIGNILKYAVNEMKVTLNKVDDNIQIIFENQTFEKIADSKKLINRFYTADISRNNQSIGLGLSIVQSLVTTLGGKMIFNNNNNDFTIKLIFKHILS